MTTRILLAIPLLGALARGGDHRAAAPNSAFARTSSDTDLAYTKRNHFTTAAAGITANLPASSDLRISIVNASGAGAHPIAFNAP